MVRFWDFNSWGVINTFAVLLLSLIVAHILKENLKFIKKSLIPTSVLGGLILLLVATIYNIITDNVLFDLNFFGGKGSITMEIVTYHALALGFIASTLKKSDKKFDKTRNVEIFNTGLTTVASYLMQGALGIAITMIAVYLFNSNILSGAGALLPFGYGQGTGQALNYGTIFEEEHNFAGGAHFGLTIAALGFLSACIGGVIYLNILKRKGKLPTGRLTGEGDFTKEVFKDENEIPTNGGMDKLTVQIILIAIVYTATFGFMYLVGYLFDGLKSTIYGLNFLVGVIFAILLKTILNALNKKNVIKKQYTNNYLLTRISNTCFDIMIVAGIAVIRLDFIKEYWLILLILGVVGAVSTFYYNLFVAKKLFPEYYSEQFLVMFGMLTGTASTGIILLREIDGEFKTPAEENLIYQNLPAIIFGFPLMFLILLAPKNDLLTLIILLVSFIAINVLLFRKQIFKKKQKQNNM